MLLGCVADDLTGATDVALMLTRSGMRTVQVMGPNFSRDGLENYDAVVVALKSRTCAVGDAVAQSVASADALLALGARQILFKYCSTFDSTDVGNIGPALDALADRIGASFAIACPAFPANKRTIYQGHLFVGDVLLSDSPMKDHPLTPMRDANLVRVLQRQTQRKVGLLPLATVAKGPEAIGEAIVVARARGERYAIADAVTDMNLFDLGTALADAELISGGSGIALGLPANFVRKGMLRATAAPQRLVAPQGRSVILAGSCSEATRGQVAAAIARGIPAIKLSPQQLARATATIGAIIEQVREATPDKPVLIYSSADPAEVRTVQADLGREQGGALVEHAFAAIAVDLFNSGFRRMIVAGGETSGAVVQALGVEALEIGPEIDPGVPWTLARGGGLALALKSGNFGTSDFFVKAWDRLT